MPPIAGAAFGCHPERRSAVAEQGRRGKKVRRHAHELEEERQHGPVAAARQDAHRDLREDKHRPEHGRERQRVCLDRHGAGEDDDDRQQHVAQ